MTPFEKLEKVTELLTYNSQTPFLTSSTMREYNLLAGGYCEEDISILGSNLKFEFFSLCTKQVLPSILA